MRGGHHLCPRSVVQLGGDIGIGGTGTMGKWVKGAFRSWTKSLSSARTLHFRLESCTEMALVFLRTEGAFLRVKILILSLLCWSSQAGSLQRPGLHRLSWNLPEWRLCLIRDKTSGFKSYCCLHFQWKTQRNFKPYVEFWGQKPATENWCLMLTVKIAVKSMIRIQAVPPKAQDPENGLSVVS